MGKVLLFLSLACLLILSFGTALVPNNAAFWLASGSSLYQHVREGLAIILLLQLGTRPPRHVWFRMLSGVVAVAAGVWAVKATYDYQMLYLDTMAFLGAAAAIGVTALERKPRAAGITASKKRAIA